GYDEVDRLASYYPAYSLFSILGAADLFAVFGAMLPLTLSVVALREGRPPAAGRVRRAASALHGESDWLPIAAAKAWFKQGGIIIGEACRTDLQPTLAGKATLLRYDGNEGSGHLLVFAGSGGYKTTGTVVPSALEWRSGLVCLDPSAEVVRLVYAARRGLNHRVVALNPEDPRSDSFNALDWIDSATDRALIDIQAVVGWLCGETPGERYDDYFKHAARALLGCLLADIIFDAALPPEHKTLALLRQRVALPIPELKELLEAIYAKGTGYGFGFPAQLAGNLKDITEKQFSGFYGEAGNATSWLAIPSLARLVCGQGHGQGFQTRHLLSGKLDIFINLPLKVLQSSPQAARVILGALLNAVYEARGTLRGGRLLFLLDEVARLGYMGILETARDTGRKYGINLCLIYQSLGQLTQGWGAHGRQAWFDAAYLRLFSHIQDYEAADYLSKACGEFTALGDSITEGSGSSSSWEHNSRSSHHSTSRQQVARRLIKPEEVLHRLRYDEQIVLIQNAPPLRCGRAIYFRRPEMVARVKTAGAAQAGGPR
ncbi:MAG TPA: type IV secretory system conjugative DNA transfer family protein, partial [Candidatus Binataceae bacterium]|nr:type IV secretory system conjugative DNA transfer family protein [Candidatus Binataceae bacterium]